MLPPTKPDAADHISVGALNPARTSVALYSNTGPWVRVFAPGTSVLSAFPLLSGATQPGTRLDTADRYRQSLDPDDHSGGYAIWSGTSFAAPFVSGMIARELAPALMNPGAVKKSLAAASADAIDKVEAVDQSLKNKAKSTADDENT